MDDSPPPGAGPWHPDQVLEFAGLVGLAGVAGLATGFLALDLADGDGGPPVRAGVMAVFLAVVLLLPSLGAWLLGRRLRTLREHEPRPAPATRRLVLLGALVSGVALPLVAGW